MDNRFTVVEDTLMSRGTRWQGFSVLDSETNKWIADFPWNASTAHYAAGEMNQGNMSVVGFLWVDHG